MNQQYQALLALRNTLPPEQQREQKKICAPNKKKIINGVPEKNKKETKKAKSDDTFNCVEDKNKTKEELKLKLY